jgi:hypothetical protein
MVATHFSGTANDFRRRTDFPDDARGNADNKSMRTARVGLAGAQSPTVIIAVPDKFPAAIVERPDAGSPKTTLWSSVMTYLIESFALFGAAMHPAAVFAVEPARDEGQIPQPPDLYPSERREFTSLISPDATQHAASPELDRRSDHVTPAGYVIAFSDDSSRERERKIKTTVAALAKLDDRTLLDMGIPHRSQIEQVVRYCHDC